jgi:hypothetical protein
LHQSHPWSSRWHNRPGRRAAYQRGEIAPPDHSITSSALASMASGTLIPSALGGLEVEDKSIFVGCIMGFGFVGPE